MFFFAFSLPLIGAEGGEDELQELENRLRELDLPEKVSLVPTLQKIKFNRTQAL